MSRVKRGRRQPSPPPATRHRRMCVIIVGNLRVVDQGPPTLGSLSTVTHARHRFAVAISSAVAPSPSRASIDAPRVTRLETMRA